MGNKKTYDNKRMASCSCVKKDTRFSVVQILNLGVGWDLVWDIEV